jgi:hypothetical protein
MYQNPDQFDQQINYGIVLANGVNKKSSATLENSPRMLYFLESLFTQGREQEAIVYLKWKSTRIEKSQPLKKITLQQFIRETPPPGILPKTKEYTLQKEYVLGSISSTSVLQQDQKVPGDSRE